MERIEYVMGQSPSDYVLSKQFTSDMKNSAYLLAIVYLFMTRIVFSKEQQTTSSSVKDQKRKGWVLTTFLAMFSSLSFFVWIYNEYGTNKTHLFENIYGSSRIGEFSITLNCIYFILDNIMMDYVYPECSDLQAKLHHYLYIGFMGSSLYLGCPNLFLTFGLVELPTAMLGVGRMFPSLRTDLPLIVIFFLTRIVYHAYIAKYLYDTMDVSPFKTAFGGSCTSFFLHVYWLFMFIKSWKKHEKKKLSCKEMDEDEEPEFRMFDSKNKQNLNIQIVKNKPSRGE